MYKKAGTGLQEQKALANASELVSLSFNEQTLIEAFRSLSPPERGYLLEDAKKYLAKR